jgi:AcrR family transcriptional regulator
MERSAPPLGAGPTGFRPPGGGERGRRGSLRRPTPTTAFHGALRAFLAGERLDMRTLANRLEISRTTLYRWTGQREHLLTDVLCHLTERSFEQARAEASGLSGVERIVAVLETYQRTLGRSPAMRTFLTAETPLAMRLLTSRGGRVQVIAVRVVEALLREEAAGGCFTPRADPALLAFAIVRLTEGLVYYDLIVDGEPQLDRAGQIVRLMLT